MVRVPCCEKMGMKKGPWTPEEDQILISFVQQYGHDNWRALPKLAGLLRCGKSCRLRWTNYLRPDIKRGNFSKEEEETIIKLHQIIGNRWSAIANRLPGRTDNEIKNFWHTHLKKKVHDHENLQLGLPNLSSSVVVQLQSNLLRSNIQRRITLPDDESSADQASNHSGFESNDDHDQDFAKNSEAGTASSDDSKLQFLSTRDQSIIGPEGDHSTDMDFWYNLFMNNIAGKS